MELEQRAAIGGEIIAPILFNLKRIARNAVGVELTDDDVTFAALWAVMRHSVLTTGGTGAIEQLRDMLDEIERSGAFGIARR